MNEECFDAMRHAVDLARSGQFSNWWTIQARLRTKGYKLVDLAWTETQQEWLDRLSAEARAARLDSDAWRPTG